MHFQTIFKLIGVLLMMFSFTMLTPIIINLIYQDGSWQPYVYSFLMTCFAGFVLWYPSRNCQYELKTRDGFLIVSLFWIVICFFAAFPFMLSLHPTNGFTDSMFESVSGFTTTGASIIPRLEKLPHDILFYRQQLQLLGGMGIIVLAVAVLPMLGVGGMQLYRAETPGPMKDNKLTPRITESAKALWMIYLFLALACTLSFYLAGMNLFEAVGETFAVISTGGFSLHDNSFAYYNSTTIEMIACVFMLLGGVNFSLHFLAFKNWSIKQYWQDEEFKFYILLLLTSCLFITIILIINDVVFSKKHYAITKSLFNVISLSTTTGLTSAPFSIWPSFAPILIMFLAITGGCAASTSGGIKVIRFLLLFKGTKREIIHLIHPNAIHNIKFGEHTLSRQVLQSMWGFISIFTALFVFFTLALLALGNDLLTSFGAVTAALANAGAGLGKVSSNFATLSIPSKWLLMFGMLLGRLEIFSLLVLFTPHFWRK